MNGKVTIYTVAQEAGVSPSTVSRFLTGKAAVGEEKRERIAAAIQKYKFTPNAVARKLTNTQTKTLGFILPDVTHPFYGTAFLEAERCALKNGYTILLFNTLNDNMVNPNKIETRYINMIMEQPIDGLIMMGGHIHDSSLEPAYYERLKLLTEQIPVVMMSDDISPLLNCYRISVREEEGVQALVNYLVTLKHENIGIVGGIPGIQPTDKRLANIKTALASHGLAYHPEWYIDGDFSIESGREGLEQILQLRERPTAVICMNDLVAIGAIHAAARSGLRVPGDISIAGFDNIYLTEYITPAITSIDLNPKGLGERAVSILVDALGGEKPPRETVLGTRLVIRDSCISNSNL